MKTKTLIGALAAASLSFSAHATLLDFDSPLTSGTKIAGYGGLTWTNMGALDPSSSADYTGTGFASGVISKKNIAFNFAGNPASIGATGGFLLNSGWFTAAYYNNLTLDFIGTSGANKLTKTVTLGLQPLLVEFDWTIDLLELRTSCDTGATCVPGGDQQPLGFHFALDNLRIGESKNTVPEPGMLALLGGGLLGMTLVRRRRKAPAA
mgnify:CR=1 FL=1